FGKRRAYQRKAAVADFKGICSAHAFVLRAIPEVIEPRLFPFFLHSDEFMHRAVDISVGGLSPTINWGDLKHQEFLLPPKDQQAELSELLWSMDEVIEKGKGVLERLDNYYHSSINNMDIKENFKPVKLSELSNINRESLGSKTLENYTFKYLDIASIVEPKSLGDLKVIDFKNAPSRARRVTFDNSIIISMVRPYQKSFIYLEDSSGIIASTGVSVIETKKPFHSKYIFHQFFSDRFIKYCEDRMTGTNYPAITPTDLKNFKILIPEEISQQKDIAERFESIDQSIVKIKNNITKSLILQKLLINQIF
ncbi:MAG: restriction endonuclease subunit S, partial [Cyclobacteriaceae bacterium]